MVVRPLLARAFWAVSGYRLRSEPPPASGSAVFIGAPHTSNWDFVFMLAICWDLGLSPKWLGKHTLFKPPFGWVMRALGGLPVDRGNPAGLVDEIVVRARTGRPLMLVIAPEGTRRGGGRWKSGFYRIAREAQIPVTLGYVDRTTMTTGLGPTIELTGDVSHDMDVIRAFYADKSGVRPERRVEPRLRNESASE